MSKKLRFRLDRLALLLVTTDRFGNTDWGFDKIHFQW